MIIKLDDNDRRRSVIAKKLNEVIDEVNRLSDMMPGTKYDAMEQKKYDEETDQILSTSED